MRLHIIGNHMNGSQTEDSSLPPATAAERWEKSALADKLGHGFLLAGKLIQRRLELALAEAGLGLTQAQARAILVLHFVGAVSQQELAAHCEVEPSTLVSTLDVMEREGLARREPNPTDRRAYRVQLTPRGEAQVPRLFSLWEVVEEELSEALDPTERRELMRKLRRVVARLSVDDGVGR